MMSGDHGRYRRAPEEMGKEVVSNPSTRWPSIGVLGRRVPARPLSCVLHTKTNVGAVLVNGNNANLVDTLVGHWNVR